MGDVELRAIFAEAGPDFSAEICVAATMSDLSPEALADYRARWARKAANARIATWDDVQTLTDAELMTDGRLTYAALILFGTRAALGRHLAQSEIVFEYRSSEATGPAQDRVEVREGFFLFHTTVFTIHLRLRGNPRRTEPIPNHPIHSRAVTQWRRVTPTSDLRSPTSLLTLASGFWHLASLVAAPPRYDLLWQKINLRNDRQSYQDGLFRYDIPTFDEIPVREALLNAVAHRDYRLGGSVFVKQFARRLEIVSPGGFPPGITPENIIDQQNPRNRRLAEALARCGLIERSGQGLNLMIETAIRQSKPLPSFSGSAAHEVRLTLEGSVKNPAFIRFLERLGEEKLRSFSTYDFLALDAIARDSSLSEAMHDRLSGLIDAGAVECLGRGRGVRYLLSRELYASIGKKGTYTRRRGLDHETNKALLEKHLRENAIQGAPLFELCQVLPSLSESAVQRLLGELRSEGRVVLQGTRRWARWFFAEAKAQKAINPKSNEPNEGGLE
jgi:predicted HTH transcriptional regulator